MLTASAALTLALSCAPQVAPDVLLSVAYTESHWHTLTIHDNATGEALEPGTKNQAIEIASRLISEGHNPDLGLLQINAANLSRTGLTVATAFDPCASMRAGAQVLLEDYRGGTTSAERQSAILRALSAYNTGSPAAGLRTYAPLVLASAQKIIPALQISGVVPYVPPPAAAPQSPSKSCEPGGWHYSTDKNCRNRDADWHFSAGQIAGENPTRTAASTGSISEGNP